MQGKREEGKAAVASSREKIFQDLLIQARTRIQADTEEEGLRQEIFHIFVKEIRQAHLTFSEALAYTDRLLAKLLGYDVLDPLFQNPEISEIMCNGYQKIFFEREGRLEKSSLSFATQEDYRDFIQRLVAEAGKEVNRRNPICDCRLKNGSRLNVVMDPIADGESCLTIRRFQRSKRKLPNLVQNGTLSREAMTFLSNCVRARLNIFICGGTGSGKTTLLNALAAEIPAEERIITVEDSRELELEGPRNWIALEVRKANAEGVGEIPMRQLIKSSLRMRPDRIIVGEVRGEEVVDMLQAMNTGHDGSLSTGHANSIPDMQLRLETMALTGYKNIPLSAIRRQIGSAIDLFVYLSRRRDHKRYVVEITELENGKDRLQYHPLFTFEEDGKGSGRLQRKKGALRHLGKFLQQGIADPFQEKEMTREEKMQQLLQGV